MVDPVLELDAVTAGYGPTHVLRGVDLCVRPGERLAVIGRNGAGKTTLLKTIMGLTRMHAGSVRMKGQGIDLDWCRRRAIYSPRLLSRKT
jgi:branched-chain amino acid transport system ATP-binding protein